MKLDREEIISYLEEMRQINITNHEVRNTYDHLIQNIKSDNFCRNYLGGNDND